MAGTDGYRRQDLLLPVRAFGLGFQFKRSRLNRGSLSFVETGEFF
jgi:hypothetical protein